MRIESHISPFLSPDGRFSVGGIDITRLAERVGSTPFFAYDRSVLNARIRELRGAMPESVNLNYAVKANPMPAIVQHLSGLVDGLDVASAGEMKVALDTGIDPACISFAGPGKSLDSLRQAVAAGIMISIESETELDRLERIGAETGWTPRVAMRINPDFEVKGSGMKMGGGARQFGIDAECASALLPTLHSRGIEFLGFHIFAGSQNLDAQLLCDSQRKTVELALRLASDSSLPVRYLNLGGGFGIPYFERDEPLDLGAIGENLANLIETRISTTLPDAKLVIELGRYIVGECGLYVTRVIDRKVSRKRTFLVVDGGLHHQLAASGNFGQVIRRNYPLAIANRIGEPASESANVVGCLCTPLDLLGDDVSVPRAEIGDLVVIFQAGAYGLTASPTAFLGHPPPAEVLV